MNDKTINSCTLYMYLSAAIKLLKKAFEIYCILVILLCEVVIAFPSYHAKIVESLVSASLLFHQKSIAPFILDSPIFH